MRQGRVSVNGTVVSELGSKADPARDDIRVDGRRVKPVEARRYLLLNKPRGYVSTRSDPERRPTVIDLLVGVREYIYPVGRLDFDSEGLLLLTNDGDLAAALTHPRQGVARVYEVGVLGVPDEHDLDRLRRGIVIDGRRTGTADVRLTEGRAHLTQTDARGRGPDTRVSDAARHPGPRDHARGRGSAVRGGGAPRTSDKRLTRSGPTSSRTMLVVTISEGRNREVRKMLDAIGHPVTSLRRVAFGPIRDGRLKPGSFRDLTADEVSRLRKLVERKPPPRGSANGKRLSSQDRAPD
jgi:pseudouridine synthase